MEKKEYKTISLLVPEKLFNQIEQVSSAYSMQKCTWIRFQIIKLINQHQKENQSGGECHE